MLTIDAFPAPSPIHCWGLFAGQEIAAGEVVWRYGEGDSRIAVEESFPIDYHYGYVNPDNLGYVVKCGDISRFWNFGLEGAANCAPAPHKTEGEYDIVATRDIRVGEELLISLESDGDAARKLVVE